MPMRMTPAMRGQRGLRNAGMMRGAAARAFAARTKGPGPASPGLCLNGTSTIVARRFPEKSDCDSRLLHDESQVSGTVRRLRLLLNGHAACAASGQEETTMREALLLLYCTVV